MSDASLPHCERCNRVEYDCSCAGNRDFIPYTEDNVAQRRRWRPQRKPANPACELCHGRGLKPRVRGPYTFMEACCC
jgi:hypothetical protein